MGPTPTAAFLLTVHTVQEERGEQLHVYAWRRLYRQQFNFSIRLTILTAHIRLITRVRTVMENLENSWNFKMVISRPGKVMEKNLNHKSFGKIMEMLVLYSHEFEIININGWICT